MKKYKPVSIPSGAFLFCRYGIAILVWAAYILKMKELMLAVSILFVLSVLLKIKRSPLILFYRYTINKIIKSKEEVLNEHAMWFAHILGSILSIICLILLYFMSEKAGWIAVLIFAILKSISAIGFCPASKLYECATSDSCCTFLKKS